jgi:acyl carrier protein
MPGSDRVDVDAGGSERVMAANDRPLAGDGRGRPDAAEIRAWLVGEVAVLVRTSPDEVDPLQPFLNYGIGSSQAIELAAKLEDWIDRPLTPTLIWDYPNIESLARHLAETPDSVQAADRQDDR